MVCWRGGWPLFPPCPLLPEPVLCPAVKGSGSAAPGPQGEGDVGLGLSDLGLSLLEAGDPPDLMACSLWRGICYQK